MRFVPAMMYQDFKASAPPRRELGARSGDVALGGGLARGRVHEVYAAEEDDTPGAAGFAAAVVGRLTDPDQALLWLRMRRGARAGGVTQANG